MPPSSTRSQERRPTAPGTFRLGTVSGIDVTVASSWFLIVGLIAVLMAPRIEVESPGIGTWAYVVGAIYAVLLYGSVLVHEVAHAVAARLFDMPVRSINLHFLGGATEIDGEATTPWREFVIAVVGPLTSLLIGGACVLAARELDGGLVEFTVATLAAANIIVGVLNLVPGLPLDGGRVLQSVVWAVSGRRSLGVIVAAWGGRLAAVLCIAWPFLIAPAMGQEPDLISYLIFFMVAAFLWTGATQSLAMAKVRSKLPGLHARSLARPAIGVPAELPVAEAVRRAQLAGAGSMVVLSGAGVPVGIVSEAAVTSTPIERRPWVPIGDVARRLEEGLSLNVDLSGEALLRAMNRTPATEYVVLDAVGAVHGVLVTADVDRAFRAA